MRAKVLPVAMSLLALPLGLCWAADPAASDPALSLAEKIAAARRAPDVAGVAALMPGAAATFNASQDKSARGKLAGAMGDVLKDKDMGSARIAAAEALGQLQDDRAAWKELGRMLPDPKKTEKAVELDLAVVRAVGAAAPSAAIKDLEDLTLKAKDPALAAQAAAAFGGYGKDTRNRVKVLEILVDAGKRIRPGRSSSKNPSAEQQQRWQLVGAEIIKALNTLTGREERTFDDWELLVKDNERNLKVLFPEEPEEEEEE